jgi:hypothetical protein
MDDREYELRQLELALKDREVTAREREVAAKSKESNTSKWFNPLTIAIYVAAIGLFGNMWTTSCNNGAAARTEHQRAQSELIQSVIKTGGNELDTCGNLDFFARIGLLDDPNQSIHNACGTKGEGRVPTLPSSSSSEQTGSFGGTLIGPLVVRVEDADSYQPVENASVELTPTNWVGGPLSRSMVTNAQGVATLNFVWSNDGLTVSKEGYETTTLKSLGQLPLALVVSHAPLPIDLHRTPAAKK